jgi:hypothetical protein
VSYREEIQRRVDGLAADLNRAYGHSRLRAIADHWLAILALAGALMASAVAGFGGLFFGLDPKMASGLALFPGALALAANLFRFQGKANWHYRKMNGLKGLQNELLYQLPESPEVTDIARVATAWKDLNYKMQVEWQREFYLTWTAQSLRTGDARAHVKRPG